MDKTIYVTAVILTTLAVVTMTRGTPYVQYYPVGEAYVLEGKADDGEIKYLPISGQEYERDPINKEPKPFERIFPTPKTYEPNRAARIQMWNEVATSTVGRWLPESSYVHFGAETKTTEDDMYFVCHTGQNCSGNGNITIYRINEEGMPKLTAMLESRLPSLVKTAYAAVAHDSTTSSTFQTAVSSYSFSHTHPTGSNTMLMVCTGTSGGDATRPVTGITYNTVAMTKVAVGNEGSSADITAEQWMKTSPATGANTVAVTWTGVNTRANTFATSYTGVNQTGTLITSSSTSILNVASWNISLTASTTDHYISDCRVMGSNAGAETFTVNAPATSRGNEAGLTINHGLANLQATTTVTNISWLCTGVSCANRDWGGTMVAIRAAAGGVVQAITSDLIIFE